MDFTAEQIAQFPPWLQVIVKATPEQRAAFGYTDEYVEQAAKAYHLDKDYTQAKQKLAGWEKVEQRYPGVTADQMTQVYDFYAGNQAEIAQFWNNRDRVKQFLAGQTREPDTQRPAGARRSYRDFESADLYETQRLREFAESIDNASFERGEQARKDWYDKEIGPQWDQRAAGYFNTMLELVDTINDPDLRDDKGRLKVGIRDVIKESAARGNTDPTKFRDIAKEMIQRRQEAEKAGYDRAMEDAKKAAPSAEGPSGPMGGAPPFSWKPAPSQTNGQPQTKEQQRASILAAVESKHGKRLPL